MAEQNKRQTSISNSTSKSTVGKGQDRQEKIASGLRDVRKMNYSRMAVSGLGNLVILIICFWIHWGLGLAFAVFWLFVMPYLDMRRLRKYEAEHPPVLPSSKDFDDSPLFPEEDQKHTQNDEQDDQWKSWDDWDAWQSADTDSKDDQAKQGQSKQRQLKQEQSKSEQSTKREIDSR
ncbi:hypothetical protein DC083_00910 [Ignatzschineria ureiclastica]|uniref:2TM domain-containing protein n=1 Tax=Ignatzschineria ureiclastica TaxID=472582 RepID=A0A2U2AGJ9_9GAMM|nr:hypothetical protein [Ignatzschineria ureiclastica]PWD81786.1 hypothetical protein DC083_00910 [Ignatzschineria ureiclastica]GGZ90520.1 hypothetical protein GCM10007162_01750 [Ignatzschineria ureiclastica]